MSDVLLGVQGVAVQPALGGDPFSDGALGLSDEGFGRFGGLGEDGGEVGKHHRTGLYGKLVAGRGHLYA